MPIDIIYVNGEYFVVNIVVERVFFREPFFIDSLLVKFGLKLNDLEYERDLLVRSFDYSTNTDELVLLTIDDFINEFINFSLFKTNLFIFHTSRCGSTLAAQMLNMADKVFVISEPPVINQILDPHLGLPKKTISRLLKSAINLINLFAPANAISVVIKFRSWNILFIEDILNAFPSTPWFFIHRDGKEVIPSILANPPGWLRAQKMYAKDFSRHLYLDENYCKYCDSAEFATRLIGVFCRMAYENRSKYSKFIDYREITTALINSTEHALGYSFTAYEKHQMEKRCLYDSKKIGNIKFIDDSIRQVQSLNAKHISFIETHIESQRTLLFNL